MTAERAADPHLNHEAVDDVRALVCELGFVALDSCARSGRLGEALSWQKAIERIEGTHRGPAGMATCPRQANA